jgi:hypothetical protein
MTPSAVWASPRLLVAFSPAVSGAAGAASAPGTTAEAALEPSSCPVAGELVTGATAVCAEGLPIIINAVPLGSTAGSAAPPGTETLRLI